MSPELQAVRLAAVINRIIEEPDNWRQEHWHCGSAHCFAGHADVLAGYWDPRRIHSRAVRKNSVAFRELVFGVELEMRIELENSTFERARRWLGLTKVEAYWLFDETTPFAWMYSFVTNKVEALEGRNAPGSVYKMLEDVERKASADFIEDGIKPIKDYPKITLPGEPPV